MWKTDYTCYFSISFTYLFIFFYLFIHFFFFACTVRKQREKEGRQKGYNESDTMKEKGCRERRNEERSYQEKEDGGVALIMRKHSDKDENMCKVW